jgi:hypothetical protein
MDLQDFKLWLGQPNYSVTTGNDNAWFLGLNMWTIRDFSITFVLARRFETLSIDAEELAQFFKAGLTQNFDSKAEDGMGSANQITYQKRANETSFSIGFTPSDPLPRNFNVTLAPPALPSSAYILTASEAQSMLYWLENAGTYDGLKSPDNLFTSINGGPDIWGLYYDKTVIQGGVGLALLDDSGNSFNYYPFGSDQIDQLRNYVNNPIGPDIECTFDFGANQWIWQYHPDRDRPFSFRVVIKNGKSQIRNITETDVHNILSWLDSIPR